MNLHNIKKNVSIISKILIILIGLIYPIKELDLLRHILIFIVGIFVFYSYFKYNYKRNNIALFSILFLVVYTITIIFNGYIFYNVIELVNFFIVIFGLMNVRDEDDSFINIAVKIFILFSFIMSIICLIMYVFYYSGGYYLGDNYEHIGMYQGRLWGLFNANITAFLSLSSIVFSVIGIIKNKYKKFLIINLILQIHIFIYTQSRSMWISLAIIIFVVLFKNINNYILKILLPIVLILGLYFTANVYSSLTIYIPKAINRIIDKEEVSSVNDDNIEAHREIITGNISQGRLDLWKRSYEIGKDKRIFGTGIKPFREDADKYFMGKWIYIVRNAGIHNIYIMVFIVNGMTGLVCVLGLFISIAIKVIKYILTKAIDINLLILSGFILSFFIDGFIESRILYTINYFVIIAYLTIGYTLNKISKEK